MTDAAEDPPTTRQRIAAWAITLGAVAALVWGAFTVTKGVTESIDYWTIDDRTFGVLAISGPNANCEIAQITESPAKVQVVVVCQDHYLVVGSSAVGYPYELVVSLRDPLANRQIVDGNGRPANLCQTARCR